MQLLDLDRVAIEQAALRYGFAFDDGDVDSFVSVFTADGVFEVFLDGQTEPLNRITGRAELADFVEAGAPGGGSAIHHVSPLLFDELTSDAARTRSTLTITKLLSRGPVVVAHGIYRDLWARDEGQWRLARRTFLAAGYLGSRTS